MTPGFHNVPAADYYADRLVDEPTLSNSIAQILLRESPLKAWTAHPRLNPNYREVHDDKFDLGTVAHQLLLEGDTSRVVVVDAGDWRTNKAKEAREEARSTGKTALLARHYADVEQMVKAALRFIEESEIAPYWRDAESELTAVAQINGVWCKARLDRITIDRSFILDYKSTESAEPEAFSRQLVRMGYHWQDAFYRMIVSELTDFADSPRFVFLAQSVEPPHECTLHGCDPALREIADFDVQRALALWKDCLKRKSWPSYEKRIHWAMPTNWQMSAYELALQEAA